MTNPKWKKLTQYQIIKFKKLLKKLYEENNIYKVINYRKLKYYDVNEKAPNELLIYFLFSKNKLVYIGKCSRLRSRIKFHQEKHRGKITHFSYYPLSNLTIEYEGTKKEIKEMMNHHMHFLEMINIVYYQPEWNNYGNFKNDHVGHYYVCKHHFGYGKSSTMGKYYVGDLTFCEKCKNQREGNQLIVFNGNITMIKKEE